jgi:hypothetical protein
MSTSKIDAIISKTQAADKIATSKGKYFGVTFEKKDGTLRHMVGRIGVRKGTTGQGLKFDPAVRGLRVVNETVIERGEDRLCRTTANQFRMVNVETLRSLRLGGKKYLVLSY